MTALLNSRQSIGKCSGSLPVRAPFFPVKATRSVMQIIQYPRSQYRSWFRRFIYNRCRIESTGGSRFNLAEPILDVIVHGDAADAAVGETEEGTGRETVGLAGDRWKAFVGREVFADHSKLRGRAVG